MKQIIKDNFIELIAIFIVFVDLFYNVIPTLPLVFVLIIVSLFRTGIIGGFVLSSYALPKLLGYALFNYGITGVATLLMLFLFVVCIFLWLINKEIFFHNFSKCFLLLLIVFLLFVVSSLLTKGGDYAITKIKDTVITGTITLFAYGFLLSNKDKCNYTRVGLYLLLFSLLMLLLSPLLNHASGPEGILDFGYLRRQNYQALIEESLLVEYQQVGFTAMLGVGILMLEPSKTKASILFVSFCIFLSMLISLYSGARQFMIISFILLLLNVFSLKENKKVVFFILVTGIAFAILLAGTLFSDGGMFESVKEDGYLEGSGRGLYLLKGINDFLSSPIIGVGFGRFEFYGEYGLYPHNMIVEILCELGLIGLTLLFIIAFEPLKYLVTYQKNCLYLFIVFLMRSMASGGLDSNIMLFSFVFAVMCLKKRKLNKKNIDNFQKGIILPSFED